MSATVSQHIPETAKKCRELLAAHYGARFKGLVLYGSLARAQASAASDMDLLVLLAPPCDFFAELRQIVDLLYPLQMESERLISAKPTGWDDFEQGKLQLYRNARREGILL